MKTSVGRAAKILLVSVFLLTAACNKNIFTSFANTTADDALLFEAKQALDQNEYSNAIAFIELMTTAGQAERETLAIKASAFAGRCGFQFLDFVENISESEGGRFFELLMQSMPSSSTTKRDDCIRAIEQLQAISTDAADRTGDENILMALVSLATIGSIFNTYMDADSDNTVDSYDHCSTADLPSNDAKEVVASLANALASLGAIGSSSVASEDMESLQGICDDLAAIDPDFNFCQATDVDDVSADHEKAMRGVIGSDNTIGLGGSSNAGCPAGADEATCAAACP
jgi:hypothetical protein